MPVSNAEIANIFDEYADLLEINNANEYRVQAYRTAARNISYLSHNVADMVRRGEDLTELPGIAEDLAGKVTEIVKTGRLSALESLKRTIPRELIEITHIAGLGPRRAFRLYYGIGISSVKELEQAALEGRIKEIPGFGIKLEQAILADIQRRGERRTEKRILWAAAEKQVQPLLAYLWDSRGVKQVEAAGSFRRGSETVGDLDIVAACSQDCEIMERFISYEDVESVLSHGTTRSTVVLRSGLQVDLRAVPEESFGAALHYFTGSQPHVIAVRKRGIRRRLKINEYGVFKGDELVAGKTEEEVYNKVGLPYIEPELRENRGEIEAALQNRLPALIMPEDIRGDLHAHTRLTDGRSSLVDMVNAAREKGYEYIAITEHSRRLTVAHGLDERRLADQIEEIDKLNSLLHDITVLKGIEVDIMEDGSLDLPRHILKKLDLVVCSVHYKFKLSKEKQTERIIRAMHNPCFMVLAHPTGRLIQDREPYDVDMERIIREARETGCVLELNGQPDRLDLDDIYCRMAREMGVLISISSDAHSTEEFDFMRYGVLQARRGWLEPQNVINTRSRKELGRILQRARREEAAEVR